MMQGPTDAEVNEGWRRAKRRVYAIMTTDGRPLWRQDEATVRRYALAYVYKLRLALFMLDRYRKALESGSVVEMKHLLITAELEASFNHPMRGPEDAGTDYVVREHVTRVVGQMTTKAGQPLWVQDDATIRAHARDHLEGMGLRPDIRAECLGGLPEAEIAAIRERLIEAHFFRSTGTRMRPPEQLPPRAPKSRPVKSGARREPSKGSRRPPPSSLALVSRIEVDDDDEHPPLASTRSGPDLVSAWAGQQLSKPQPPEDWRAFVLGSADRIKSNCFERAMACDIGPLVNLSLDAPFSCLTWAAFKPSLLCFRFCGSDDGHQDKIISALEHLYASAPRQMPYVQYRASVMACVGESVVSCMKQGCAVDALRKISIPCLSEEIRRSSAPRDDVGLKPYRGSLDDKNVNPMCLQEVVRLALLYVFKDAARIDEAASRRFLARGTDLDDTRTEDALNVALRCDSADARRGACRTLCAAAKWTSIEVLLDCIGDRSSAQNFVREQVGKAWLAYLHVTGKRALSPFLSCTAYMPGMLDSPSDILRNTVIPSARELLTLCLEGDALYVAWIANALEESSSCSIVEREVLLFGDEERPLKRLIVHRAENPFRKTK
jgi:hypothetical protein